MKQQLDLFEWADAKPSNVIDAMPALINKAAMEAIYGIPNRRGDGKVIRLGAKAA
ncbi:hypothetical protein [Rhizobium sp. 21-4511-3d]